MAQHYVLTFLTILHRTLPFFMIAIILSTVFWMFTHFLSNIFTDSLILKYVSMSDITVFIAKLKYISWRIQIPVAKQSYVQLLQVMKVILCSDPSNDTTLCS